MIAAQNESVNDSEIIFGTCTVRYLYYGILSYQVDLS
jgi:hypothetical protein